MEKTTATLKTMLTGLGVPKDRVTTAAEFILTVAGDAVDLDMAKRYVAELQGIQAKQAAQDTSKGVEKAWGSLNAELAKAAKAYGAAFGDTGTVRTSPYANMESIPHSGRHVIVFACARYAEAAFELFESPRVAVSLRQQNKYVSMLKRYDNIVLHVWIDPVPEVLGIHDDGTTNAEDAAKDSIRAANVTIHEQIRTLVGALQERYSTDRIKYSTIPWIPTPTDQTWMVGYYSKGVAEEAWKMGREACKRYEVVTMVGKYAVMFRHKEE